MIEALDTHSCIVTHYSLFLYFLYMYITGMQCTNVEFSRSLIFYNDVLFLNTIYISDTTLLFWTHEVKMMQSLGGLI